MRIVYDEIKYVAWGSKHRTVLDRHSNSAPWVLSTISNHVFWSKLPENFGWHDRIQETEILLKYQILGFTRSSNTLLNCFKRQCTLAGLDLSSGGLGAYIVSLTESSRCCLYTVNKDKKSDSSLEVVKHQMLFFVFVTSSPPHLRTSLSRRSFFINLMEKGEKKVKKKKKKKT